MQRRSMSGVANAVGAGSPAGVGRGYTGDRRPLAVQPIPQQSPSTHARYARRHRAAAPGLAADLRDALARSIAQVNGILLGKKQEVRLAFVCLLAGGHLLIEDLPGVGKTTLAHALAITLGLDFQRVQFTSDLLPSDIIGVSIYERDPGIFKFHNGPVFTQLLLADEINRATPKTQSALLEAMAEGQVTVDGRTHALPSPFFVVATQNPVDFAGTYPLPDSQLDRFMLRMSLGYPDRGIGTLDARLDGSPAAARATRAPASPRARSWPCARRPRSVLASSSLIAYVQSLLEASRRHAEIRIGLSPRAGLAILAAARAHALLGGRNFVVPEDVQKVFPVHRRAPPEPRFRLAGKSCRGGRQPDREHAGAMSALGARTSIDLADAARAGRAAAAGLDPAARRRGPADPLAPAAHLRPADGFRHRICACSSSSCSLARSTTRTTPPCC